MEYLSRAECIEINDAGFQAVIVAEGLRSWQAADGTFLISRGPRLFAKSEKLGRLRTVPDRLGVVDNAAETHAVVLAKLCRGEEMEITQRWQSGNGTLSVDITFIVPPAWDGMETLGVELELPQGNHALSVSAGPGVSAPEEVEDSGMKLIRCCFSNAPVSAGIHHMSLAFHQFSQSSSK